MTKTKRQPSLFFVNCGHGPHRNWEDCRKYGFISAGQGRPNQKKGFFSNQLKNLITGDIAAVYYNRYGYVAIGRIMAKAVKILDYKINNEPVTPEMFHSNAFDNSDNANSEYLVRMEWLRPALPGGNAKCYGIYAKPHVVCSLDNQRHLRKELEKEFKIDFKEYLPNYRD